MASGLGRSLYVGLKADTKGFSNGLSKAERRMQSFKNGVKTAGLAIAASFAAIGVAALAFGKSAVEAAIEDEKSMRKLARTVKNNTKVTQAYQHTVEKSVTAMQNQFHIADDKLRPAFAKLVTATKSVSKSQKLMRVALDVSAGTGKDLDVVVAALSKAYLGNNTAVGKLGVGIDKAKLKTMTFDQITKNLSHTFRGQATDAANSWSGQVDGLKIAWSEFQESIGYKILPKIKTLLNYIKNDLLPFLGQVQDGFNGTQNETISPKLRAVGKAMGFEPGKSAAYTLGEALKNAANAFTNLFESLSSSKGADGASTLEQIAGALTTFANAITNVTNAISSLSQKWRGLPGPVKGFLLDPFGIGDVVNGVGQAYTAGRQRFHLNANHNATGGPTIRNRPYLVGEQGPELMVPSGSGHMLTAKQTAGMGGGTTIINLNGIVDADSARRSIERVLQNSGKRLGAINLTGSAL